MTKQRLGKFVFWLGLFVCCLPHVSAGLALLLGAFVTLLFGDLYARASSYAKTLLGLCLIGLGATLNLNTLAQVGLASMGYTIASLIVTFVLGSALARIIKVDAPIHTLITTGTAICGGSAIAAVSPVIGAKARDMSIALAVVFMLNAVALYLFPPLGKYLQLTDKEFGLWAALAIHDTSSVVGAALSYSQEALKIATTVKLTRALWILPLAFSLGFWHWRRKSNQTKQKVSLLPFWYLAGFIAMSAIFSWIPFLSPYQPAVGFVAKRGMVVVLFLIGTSLSWQTMKQAGPRCIAFGVVLWAIVGTALLGAIKSGWIH